MYERPPFWRWLVQVSVGAVRGMPGALVWAIRSMPGMVRAIRKLNITEAIRNPFYEFFTGMIALVVVISLLPASGLTLDTRIVLALFCLPSFLLVMHGLYRAEGDC